MQLADLLAREGYSSRDVPALLSWARARASALLQSIDPDSSVGALLDGLPGHVVRDSRVTEQAPVSSAVSFSSDGDDLDNLEDDDGDIPADLREAVTAATTSQPQPSAPDIVYDDPDSGFGGFARFQSLLKLNRPYPYRQEPVVDERPTLTQSFARANRREVDYTPSPPSYPPADLSATLPLAAALGMVGMGGEESGALVLGIPDEDAAESSGLSDLFDPDAGPDVVESLSSQPSSGSRSGGASGFVDDDDEPPAVRRGTGTARATFVDDDDESLGVGALVDDDDAPLRAPVDDELPPPPERRDALTDDDELPPPPGRDALADDDDAQHGRGAPMDDDDDDPFGRGALMDDDDDLGRGALMDDDDDAPSGRSPPSTMASSLDADDTNARPGRRTRDTPPMPGLPAIDIDHENGAPVLRHRTPKKKVVELGAPVGKPRAGSGAAAVAPRGPSPQLPSARKPPPPPARKPPPPPPVDDDIQELSRVELIEDLPSYLRDDDE